MAHVTATFTQNAGNFTMDQSRFEAVVEQSGLDEEWVNSALFYDWENADDHQEWLDTAPISEIAEWVSETVASWK